MAINLLTGEHTSRDWSCGASDLPRSFSNFIPETYWGPPEMEGKLHEIMSKGKAFGFGEKPSREEALVTLASYMKSHKIGPRDVQAGVGAEVGSILFPAKDQTRLMNKLDDVRYDIRGMRAVLGGALYALAGATAVVGFAKVYKTARG